jgi:hypothetical protein
LSSVAGLALAASARSAVVVQFAEPADYRVWISDAKGVVLTGPVLEKGTRVVLETGGDVSKGAWTLTAVNASGNAAVVPVPAGADPKVSIPAKGFGVISRVSVKVADVKGAPPEIAAVTLTDGKGKATTRVIGAADNGVATFDLVAPGDGSVRVQQGTRANAQTVTVRLPLDHPKPVLEVSAVVTLPDGMKTLPAGAAEPDGGDRRAAESAEEKPAPPPARDAGRTAGAIVGLFLLAAVGWLGFNYLRGRGVTAEEALAKAGIRIEPDTPDIETVPAAVEPPRDPNVCPFCGQTKDPVTGACACVVPAGSTATAPSPAASARAARLVALAGPKAGSAWPIGSAVSIGRDPSQDIAIIEDTALSRRHARIQAEEGIMVVVDQGSSNGTYVNGQKVMRHVLKSGDELVMGGSRFRFEV